MFLVLYCVQIKFPILLQQIHSLQYCIQHESNTLAEEKQLLKEIKQLEASREKVIANAALRAKIQESFGQRDTIQDQVKVGFILINFDMYSDLFLIALYTLESLFLITLKNFS